MTTQQFIIDGHSGIFPNGWLYHPCTVIPPDVAAIFGSLGGACLLFTNGFELNISLETLSCRGLAWVTEFLGNHPLAEHVQEILCRKVNEVYVVYNAISEYANYLPTVGDVSKGAVLIASLESLRLINIPIVGKSVAEIFVAAVDAFMLEAGKVEDMLLEHIRPNRRGLMSRGSLPIYNLVMIGSAFATTLMGLPREEIGRRSEQSPQ